MAVAATPRPGFSLHSRQSPFFDLIGPLRPLRTDDGLEFALVVDDRHVNARGLAHDGVLAALADVALGYATAFSHELPVKLISASLTIGFAGAVDAAKPMIATTDIQKVGRRVAFANCYLHSGDRRVVRASAVFANVSEP